MSDEVLYGLTESTYRQMMDTINAGGGGGFGPGNSIQSTFVKVTSATPSSGWYPCSVETPLSDGTWITHDAVCEVMPVNSFPTWEQEPPTATNALVSGRRYWAMRCGESGGKVRYVCSLIPFPETTTVSVMTDVSCNGDGTFNKTYTTIRVLIP